MALLIYVSWRMLSICFEGPMTQDSAESAPGDLRSQAHGEVHMPADRCGCLYMQGQGREGGVRT